MIKWNCDFNIPDSTIQLSKAFVKVVEYQNVNEKSTVNILISNESGDTVIKEYIKEFNRPFENVTEIYVELIKDFENSELIVG